MPKQKPDKYEREKELLADLIRGASDISGRGVLAPLLGAAGDIAGLGENSLRALVGKPQIEPWGGSEHIGRKLEKAGLVSSERRPKTELLASLVSPGAVLKTALNAPKTAVNALKAISRLDDMSLPMPRAKQGQLGAIDVWHGSPHKFDTFKAMDNIGSGEGAQAYGHGGYHASNPDVATNYSANAGKHLPNTPKNLIASTNGDYEKAISNAKQAIDDEPSPRLRSLREDELNGLIALQEAGYKPQAGNLYRNQLRWPDPAREAADPLSDKHFLDWDKPLSEQDASVRGAVSRFANEYGDFYPGLNDALQPFEVSSTTGKALYGIIAGDNPAGASRDLNSALGIPGVRYAANGGNPVNGAVSHNYVTFDDSLVSVLERNGKPAGVKAAGR